MTLIVREGFRHLEGGTMRFSFRILLFSILFIISLSGISHAQSQGSNWYTTGAASAPFERLRPGFVITEDIVNKCRDVVPPAVMDKLNSSGGTDGSDKEKECQSFKKLRP